MSIPPSSPASQGQIKPGHNESKFSISIGPQVPSILWKFITIFLLGYLLQPKDRCFELPLASARRRLSGGPRYKVKYHLAAPPSGGPRYAFFFFIRTFLISNLVPLKKPKNIFNLTGFLLVLIKKRVYTMVWGKTGVGLNPN